MQVLLKIGSSLRKHTHNPPKKKFRVPFSYKIRLLRSEFVFGYDLLEEIELRQHHKGKDPWLPLVLTRCAVGEFGVQSDIHLPSYLVCFCFCTSWKEEQSDMAAKDGTDKTQVHVPQPLPSALKARPEPAAEARLSGAGHPAAAGERALSLRGRAAHARARSSSPCTAQL